MRYGMLLGLVCFSMMVKAQANMGTSVDIVPQRPVNCTEKDYPRVSWVKDIRKIEENAETATFEFVMEHGFCENTELRNFEMDRSLVAVGMMKADGKLFASDHVKVKAELLSPVSAKVTAVFKIAKIFRDGRITQKYDMGFYPNGIPYWPVMVRSQMEWMQYRMENANKYRYPWFLYISRDASGASSLEVRTN